MTDEEIKKIAVAYSVSRPVDEMPTNPSMARMIVADALRWLSKDYAIVPKSKLKEHYEDVCEDIRDFYGKEPLSRGCADMTMYQRARGMKQMLYRLFGKDMFEEEGK